jgi:hypothetical protein
VAGDRAVVGVSTAGERGREVGDELTGGVGGIEREAGTRARGTAPRSLAHWVAGGREGDNARARQTDSQRGQVRGRAQAGPTWAKWAKLGFSNFMEFLMPYLFIFSRVFNSNSNQVSNSN